MHAAVLEVPPVDDHVINTVEVLFFGFDTNQHALKFPYAVNNRLLFLFVVLK